MTNTVTFQWQLFTTMPVSNRVMTITPAAVGTNAAALTTLDPIPYTNDATGKTIITNMVPGGYTVIQNGPSRTYTTLQIVVPPTNGNFNFRDLLGAPQPAAAANTAYSMLASDLRYLQLPPTNTPAGYVPLAGSNGLYSWQSPGAITNVSHATNADAATFATTAGGAPPTGNAGGSLTGTYPNPGVDATKITGIVPSNNLPSNLAALAQNNGANLTNLNLNIPRGTTLYVSPSGKDSSGTRGRFDLPFLTIGAAANAAHPWDLIYVCAGQYNEHDLCRSNKTLMWFYEPYPTNLYWNCDLQNDTNGIGFYDDRRTGPVTNFIYGRPNFYYTTGTNFNSTSYPLDNAVYFPGDTNELNPYIQWSTGPTNCVGMIVETNQASSFVGELGDATMFTCMNLGAYAAYIYDTTNTIISYHRLLDGMTPLQNATYGWNNIPTTNTDPDFSVPIMLNDYSQGIFWRNGYTSVDAKYIDGFSQYTLWSGDGGNPPPGLSKDTHFYVEADEMRGYGYIEGGSSHYVNWWHFKQWVVIPPQLQCLEVLGASKNYLFADKMQIDGSYNTNIPVFSLAAGETWVNTQKVQSPSSKGGAGWFTLSGGTNHLTIMELNDVGSTKVGITVSGGSNELTFQSLTMKDGIGLQHSGGLMRLHGLPYIDCSNGTHTNDWPIFVTGSGLDVGNAILISPSSTYTVWSTNAQTVISEGAKTNRPAGPTITVSHPYGTM